MILLGFLEVLSVKQAHQPEKAPYTFDGGGGARFSAILFPAIPLADLLAQTTW